MGKLNGTIPGNCNPQSRIRNATDEGTRIRIRSGDENGPIDPDTMEQTPNSLAGYSIWFMSSANMGESPPYEVEGSLHLESVTNGSPIIGAAFAVQHGSTVDSFHGLCGLLNYREGKVQLRHFTGQSLLIGNGTLLNESAINLPSSSLNLTYIHSPSVFGTSWFDVTDSSFNQLYFHDFTGQGPTVSGNYTGAGFVWIGNPDLGLHEAIVGFSNTPPTGLIFNNCTVWGQE